MSLLSYRTGKLPMNGVSENQLMSQCALLGPWLNIIRPLRKTRQDTTSFWKKVILAFTIGRRIWREDILVSDVEELKNVDASESHARRLNAMEERPRILFLLFCRCMSQDDRKGSSIPDIHFNSASSLATSTSATQQRAGSILASRCSVMATSVVLSSPPSLVHT